MGLMTDQHLDTIMGTTMDTRTMVDEVNPDIEMEINEDTIEETLIIEEMEEEASPDMTEETMITREDLLPIRETNHEMIKDMARDLMIEIHQHLSPKD